MKRWITTALLLALCLGVIICLAACGQKSDDTPHTHAYGEWVETKAPTCTAAGEKTQECSCGDKKTEAIAATGHTEQVVEGYDATCTEDGATDGTVCRTCSASITSATVIPATGHTYLSEKCSDCEVALTVAVGLEFTENGDGTYTVSGIGSCTSSEILIPREYNGGLVTGIADGAFASCDFIVVIVIPDTVTTVGDSAFSGCSALESVALSGGVTEIGERAFENCTKLVIVVICEGVESIGEGAFSGCTALLDMSLPSSLVSIGEGAFSGCTSLEISTVLSAIPDGWLIGDITVTLGHEHAYGEWQVLAAPTCTDAGLRAKYCNCGAKYEAEIGLIPHTEEVVEGYDSTCTATGLTDGKVCSVCGATTVEQETIGMKPHTDEVVEGYDSTCTATGLTDGAVCSVCGEVLVEQEIIPAAHVYENGACTACGIPFGSVGLAYTLSSDSASYIVAGIGSCTDTELIIPAFHEGLPVLMIGTNAFKNNTDIVSVVVSDGVEVINSGAFRGCSNLRSIDFGSTLTTIGQNAFRSCINLTSVDIPDSVTKLTEYAFYECKRLTSVIIGDSVPAIEDFTFFRCYSLTKLVVGKSVAKVGYDPFYGCRHIVELYNLSSLAVGKIYSNPVDVYTSLDSPSRLFVTDDGYLMYRADTCYLVGYVGYDTNLVLPESCNGEKYEIYNDAFYELGFFIESLELSANVTAIGDGAFYNCSSLTSLTIPEGSLTTIGSTAFASCSSLTNLILPEGVTSIGSQAFWDCDALVNIQLPDSLSRIINSFSFFECVNLNATEYNGAYYVGSDSNPYMLLAGVVDKTVASIELHPDVRFVGSYAFSGCTSLTSVDLPDKLEIIDHSAFSGCTALTAVYIPVSITYIGAAAFDGCTSLTIYCALAAAPESGWGTWSNLWNPNNRPVVWGYTEE